MVILGHFLSPTCLFSFDRRDMASDLDFIKLARVRQFFDNEDVRFRRWKMAGSRDNFSVDRFSDCTVVMSPDDDPLPRRFVNTSLRLVRDLGESVFAGSELRRFLKYEAGGPVDCGRDADTSSSDDHFLPSFEIDGVT